MTTWVPAFSGRSSPGFDSHNTRDEPSLLTAPDTDALRQGRLASFISLLASSGTLLCCALPALLVALGAGTTLASLIAHVPQLVWLSEHKAGIFLLATVMLATAGCMQWRVRCLPCPADPVLAAACRRTRRTALVVYCVSVGIFLTGGFFAFIAPLVF